MVSTPIETPGLGRAGRAWRAAAGAACGAVLLTATVSGQPIRDGHLIVLPESVEIHPDGSVAVITRQVRESDPEASRSPDRVPVFEVHSDGTRERGLHFRNAGATPVRSIRRNRPMRVYIEDDRYVAEVMGTSHRQDGAIKPGFDILAAGSESVPVIYGPLPSGAPRSPGFQIVWVYEHETYPPGVQAEVDALMERVKARFEGLLWADVGLMHVTVKFDSLGTSAVAGSEPIFSDPSNPNYVAMRDKLIELSDNNAEQLLNQALPAQSVTVVWPNSQQTTVDKVRLNSGLFPKWGRPAVTDDGAIIFNSDLVAQFDYDPRNDVEEGKFDAEYSVTHELIHLLGFTSPDTEDVPESSVFVWDLYRLALPDPGPAIGDQAFRQAQRMLRTGTDVVYVTQLNSASRLYRGSTGAVVQGDLLQREHWLLKSLFGGVWIGIMDPGVGHGRITDAPAGYLTDADIHALDTIGWGFVMGPPAPRPTPAQPQQPAPGEPHGSLTPNFQWTPGVGDVTDLYVFAGTNPSEATQVYAAQDLTASSHQMPFGVLHERTTYTWSLTSINFWGYAYSERRTFTTTCYANCDGSTVNPVLNVNDFQCFLNKFAAGDPYANCDGTTVPPVLNVNDFQCFLNKFAAGCS